MFTLILCWWENKIRKYFWKVIGQNLSKLKMQIYFPIVIPFLKISPTETPLSKFVFERIFTRALIQRVRN